MVCNCIIIFSHHDGFGGAGFFYKKITSLHEEGNDIPVRFIVGAYSARAALYDFGKYSGLGVYSAQYCVRYAGRTYAFP